MYHNIKKILDILKNNQYSVSAFCNKDGTITVKYPERKQIPVFSSFDAIYKFSENDSGSAGIEFNVNTQTALKQPDGYFLQCPRYSFDSVIFSDIKIVCAFIKYSVELVFFEVAGKEKTLDEFSRHITKNCKLTEEENKKRELLKEIIDVAEKEGFDEYLKRESYELGVQDGYLAIESMYYS